MVVDLNTPEYQFPGTITSALYTPVTRFTNADLTTGVDGTGVFDAIMKSFAAHLKTEYTSGRITGAEYTKAFTALVESAMGGAIQYLLGKDQAFWAAQNAQIAAITARVGLETSKYQLESLMPQQFALLKEQTEAQRAQTLNTRTDGTTPVAGTLGTQRDLSTQQIDSYVKASELNAVKAIIDTWITQKTIDEGLIAPVALQTASVNTAITTMLTSNGLV